MHTWVGFAVQVTTLQRTVKEGRHDINRAKEFTHERTKHRIAQLHSATLMTPSPVGSLRAGDYSKYGEPGSG